MTFRFPLTMKAAQGAERNQWDFADALLKECGPPGKDSANNGSSERLEAARAELAANGFEYDLNWLRKCRSAAAAFPPATRGAGVSFRVHMECGSPAMLKTVLTAREKEGRTGSQKSTAPQKALSLHDCVQLIAAIERQRRAAWEKTHKAEYEKAKVEHVKAQAAITKAKERKFAAGPDRGAQAVAATEIRQAMRAAEKAAESVEQHALPPRGDPSAVPSETKMSALLFVAEIEGKAMKARNLAQEALKMADERLASYRVGEGINELDSTAFEVIVEQAHKAADEWRAIAERFAAASGRKGIHLSVVGE